MASNKKKKKKHHVIVTDRVRVPKHLLDEHLVRSRYVFTLFKESACKPCKNLPHRDKNDIVCKECPSFRGHFNFFKRGELRRNGVWSLPQGDELAIKAQLKRTGVKFKWIDNRTIHRFDNNIKFTAKLFDGGKFRGQDTADQETAVRKWLKRGTGRLVAPPRSGKTSMATAVSCALKQKTVIIVHQKELSNQFYETFMGKPSKNYTKDANAVAGRIGMTNAAELEEEFGEGSVVYMPSSFADLEKHVEKVGWPDILIITYQSFMHDLDRIRKYINDHYSVGAIDEEHRTGASGYLRFCATLDLRHRMPITATPERKDGLSRASFLVNGPIVHEIDFVPNPPRIVPTAFTTKPRTEYKQWEYAMKWISSSKARNKEMVMKAFEDMRKGHNVIIIPVDRIVQIELLVELFNEEAARLGRKKGGEQWPIELCKGFHREVDRQKTLSWVDTYGCYENGKLVEEDGSVHETLVTDSPRVVVAITKMVKEGIDLRRPSMLYSNMPLSGEAKVGAPAWQQMAFRICTPDEKKPKPVVRLWVDNIDMFKACAGSLLKHEVKPRSTLKKNPKKMPKYIMSKGMFKRGERLVKLPERERYDPLENIVL